MNKILIIGNDIHAIQYIETLMFNNIIYLYNENIKTVAIAKNYQLNLLNKQKLFNMINYFEIIIITDIFRSDLIDIIRNIVLSNYKGKFILEKPLTFNYNDAKKIFDLLKNNRVVVAYTRQFYNDDNYFKIKLDGDIFIKWPYYSNLGIDPIKNTLPHIFDLIFKIFSKNINLIISDIILENKDYTFKLLANNNIITIVLYDTINFEKKVEINNLIFEWPNYFQVISSMVDYVFDEKKSCKENEEITLQINYLLEKVKEIIYE